MAEIIRPPDTRLLAEIANLRRDVEALKRMPSGLRSIGPPHLAVIPAAQVVMSTTNLGLNGTITWTSELRDTADMWTSGTQITAPISGLYLAECNIYWAANATGTRRATLAKNGAPFQATYVAGTAAGSVTTHVFSLVQMAAGTYIEVQWFNDSGSSLSCDANASLTWLGNV